VRLGQVFAGDGVASETGPVFRSGGNRAIEAALLGLLLELVSDAAH